MLTLYVTEFLLISLLYLININELTALLSERTRLRKCSCFFIVLYISLGVINTYFRQLPYPIIYLLSTIGFYFCLIFIVLLQHSRYKQTAIYISMLFLLIDSILQSLGCLIVELFTNSLDYFLVTKSASLIFNIICIVLIGFMRCNYSYQIKENVRLLPKSLYIMLLITLFIIGELCGNMAIESDEHFFGNRINNFLTALTILTFLVVLVFFLFSCVSRYYHESIAKIMEKQVNEQVSHYKRVDQMTQDLKEFRHDYRNHMICLQALLEGKEYEDALEYVRDITRQDIIESNKFFSGNQIADAILSDKAELAKKAGCEIKFDGFISDEIPASDLCIILSNALDNAIESCARFTSNEPKIITVKCDILQGVQLMRITNPNSSNSSTTETSKEDKKNHGFGLYNIRRTVERHNGQMSISSQTPLFVLDLEFQIK